MKKNFKRTLAAVMAAALTVTMISMPSETDAAKKIKLAKSKVTVTKGKTKTVKIKNVKKKQVKKLKITATKKAKKIATVKKSGKTALKVKGKKVGSAKFTVNVTVKGKKKATKLKLTVKVKKATPSNGGGTTQTQAPGVTTQTQAPGTNPDVTATQNPGPTTQEPGDPTRSPRPTNSPKPPKEPTATPRQWSEVTPVPQVEKPKSMILKYTDEAQSEDNTKGCGKLTEMGKIAFRDAKEGYTLGENEKFDILKYDRIVIKLNAKDRAKMGDGDNGEPYSGKIGLSSTDGEVFGAHVDGFITQYESDGQTRGKLIFLNDIDGMTEENGGTSPIAEKTYKTEAYEGGYLIEYKIPGDISKTNWWTPDDVSNYCDCINFQLADKTGYDNFYVEEIQLLSDKTATEENLEIKADKETIKVDESANLTVSMKGVPDYAEISEVEWSADPADSAALSDEAVADGKKTATAKATGKKEADKVTVTANVTVTIDGKEFKDLKVSKEIKVEKKSDNPGESDKPSESGKPIASTAPSTAPSEAPEVTEITAADLELTLSADEIEAGDTTGATVALKEDVAESMKITAVEWSANEEVATCTENVPAQNERSGSTAITGVAEGTTTITASVTVQDGEKEATTVEVVSDTLTVNKKIVVTAEDLTIDISKDEIRINETATVEVGLAATAEEGAEITDIKWAVSDTGCVEMTDVSTKTTQEFKGKAETENPVTITATVTVTVGTKEFELEKTVELGVVSLRISAAFVETPAVEVVAGESVALAIRVETQNPELGYTDPQVSVAWSLDTASAESASIETTSGERATVKTEKAGKITVIAAVTVTDGDVSRTRKYDYTFDVQSVLVPDVEIEASQKVVAKDGTITLSMKNNGEGDIEDVTWSAAADDAIIVKNADKSATVTVKKAGDVTVTAAVTVKKGSKQTKSVTKEITVKGVELETTTTKTEFAANETAGIEVGIKGDANGVEITGIDWTVDEEGIVEVQEAGNAAVLTGKVVGTVKVTPVVTVSVSGEEGETEITLEGVDFEVTPIEYEIGVDLDLSNLGQWGSAGVSLKEAITINRTDEVKVVCSINKGQDESDTVRKSVNLNTFAFGPNEKGTDQWAVNGILDNRVLESGGQLKDNEAVVLNKYNKYFVDATTTIKSVAMQVSESLTGKDAVVTVEKLIVSPTKKVPVSLYVPDKVGSTPAIAELYVDTDKEYTVEWSSTNGGAVSVVADENDQNKATITVNNKASYFRIVAVVKIDGVEVAREQSQNLDVDPDLITYAVNQQAVANFSGENELQYGGGCSLTLDTPVTLLKDKKVEALYSVKKVDKQGKETLYGGAVHITLFDTETESVWNGTPVLESQYYKDHNRIWPMNQNKNFDWGDKEQVLLDKVAFSGWDAVNGEAGDKMVITLKQLIVVNK